MVLQPAKNKEPHVISVRGQLKKEFLLLFYVASQPLLIDCISYKLFLTKEERTLHNNGTYQ